MSKIFALLLLCVVAFCSQSAPVTVTADSSPICTGKIPIYRITVIDAQLYKPKPNCSYSIGLRSGSTIALTRIKDQNPNWPGYLCYNTEGFSFPIITDRISGSVVETCIGGDATYDLDPVLFNFREEVILKNSVLSVNAFLDISCDGVPYGTARFCSFASGYSVAFALIVMLGIIFLL